jgi:hypothetical protein
MRLDLLRAGRVRFNSRHAGCRRFRIGEHGAAALCHTGLGRRAQPYEQSDPYTVQEPEGRLDLRQARYEAIDDRRTRVSGAAWIEADTRYIKLEGARRMGERAVLLCAAADPRFIARREENLREVAKVVEDLVCEDMPKDYDLRWRVYGAGGASLNGVPTAAAAGEIFIMAECLAPTAERAAEVARTTKQYLLHHGFPRRLSTGGNLAFPFTPPEVSIGTAYRFNIYHLMRAHNLDALFPLEVETL